MRLRWQWIIGLIGLVAWNAALGQKASGDTAPETPIEEAANETSTKPPLTGNPQIDYIHDPNLPHELKGYDLSDYPFYSRLPEDLLLPSFNFTCDDRYDGFYASIPHKCQVYHNCLFGQRYDFLCANFTVFDQKNFICHYVSEVDCKNSERHYDRNEQLYVTSTTTTTTPAPPQIIYIERPRPSGGDRRPSGGSGRPRPQRLRPFGANRPNRRTTTTPAPVYYDDYYYDDYYNQYYDDYYYNDYEEEKTTITTTTTTQRPRRPNRPRKRPGADGRLRHQGRPNGPFNVKNRTRPRINPPVPLDDDLSGQRPRASRLQQASPPRRQEIVDEAPVREPQQNNNQDEPSGARRRGPGPGRKPRPGGRPKKPTTTTTTTTTTTEAAPEEYDYYDYYEYADEPSSTTTTTTTARPSRPSRPSRPTPSRTRLGGQQRGQNRPQPTTTTTTTTEPPTTEEPAGRVTRPSRVNVRRNPVNSRRAPVEGALPNEQPQNPVSDQTAEPQRQRPGRLRPQFPRNRPEEQPTIDEEEIVIVEEVPLAPGVEIDADGTPVDIAENVDEAAPPARRRRPQVSRTPIRRLGQGGPARQRPGQRQRGQRSRPTPSPDYYYDI